LHQRGNLPWWHSDDLLTQSRWTPDIGWIRWRNVSVIDG
jgi:hypothetical protein